MNDFLSKKLTFFSFWLMVLVVLLHSLNIDYKSCDTFLCTVQYLLSLKLAEVAVPLFFFVTGYLYFLKTDITKKLDVTFFINNTKKRFRTILAPYILWCVFWFLFLYSIQLLPVVKNYFSKPLYRMTVTEQFFYLVIEPLNYPFWFLRELMLILLITPVVFLLIKYFKIKILVLLFFSAFFMKSLYQINGISIYIIIPLFYFSSGAFFSLHKINLLFKAKRLIAFLLLSSWLGLNLISIYCEKYVGNGLITMGIINLIKDLTGIIAIWYTYDLFNTQKQWRNYNFYRYSFFIFAFHGIPTTILVKMSNFQFTNQYYIFISYIGIFVFMVIFSILLGKITAKLTPSAYKIITGSR